MYGPSFFTGRLITRFGAPRVVATGLALIAASAAVGLTGVDVAHFWLTLISLGLGGLLADLYGIQVVYYLGGALLLAAATAGLLAKDG